MTAFVAQYSRQQVYDPLTGKWIRTTIARDIFHISSIGGVSPTTSGDFVIASGVTPATKEVLLSYVAYSASEATDFCVTVGTSTIGALRVGANSPAQIALGYRVPPSTTVQIIAKNAVTTGTYAGNLFGERRPIPAYLEPHAA